MVMFHHTQNINERSNDNCTRCVWGIILFGCLVGLIQITNNIDCIKRFDGDDCIFTIFVAFIVGIIGIIILIIIFGYIINIINIIIEKCKCNKKDIEIDI